MGRNIFVFGFLALLASGLSGCGNSALDLSASDTQVDKPWQHSWLGDASLDTTAQRIPNADRKPPSVEELMKVGPLGERSMGKKDAPVTVIEYVSLTCPFCRKFHAETFQKLKRNYIETGKIRFIMREFPIGRASGAATIIMSCGDDKTFFRLYDKYILAQHLWVSQKIRLDAIYKIAAQTGMTRAKFDSCLADKNIETALKKIKERARDFGVIGTPTFFINGKKRRGALTYEQITAEINANLS